MATNRTTHVTDDPDSGAKIFWQEEGPPLYAYGEEADALAEAYLRGPDQRLAANDAEQLSTDAGGAVSPSMADVGGAQYVQAGPPPAAAYGLAPAAPRPVAVGTTAPPQIMGGMLGGEPTPGGAPPAPAAAPQPGPNPDAARYAEIARRDPRQAALMRPLLEGGMSLEEAYAMTAPQVVYSPGRAAVTQQDLQRRAATATMMPQSGQQSRAGFIPGGERQLPGYQSALAETYDAQAQAVAAGYRAEAEARQAEADRLAADAPARQAEVIAAQLRQRDAQVYAQRRRAELEQAITESESATVDPGRWYSNVGVAGGIAAAFAMAAGEWAAIMSGTGRNTAAQLIQGAIDRDIAAQEASIAAGERRRSALADMVRMYDGDADTAKEALRVAQLRAAEAQGAQLAAGIQDKAAQARVQAQLAELGRSRMEADLALQERLLGKGMEQTAGVAMYPQAAVAGGVSRKYPTLEALAKDKDTRARLAGRPTSETEQAMMKEEAKRQAEAESGRQQAMGEGSRVVADKLEKISVARTSLEQAAAESGLVWDPEAKQYKPGQGGVYGLGTWGWASGAAARATGQESRHQRARDATKLAQAYLEPLGWGASLTPSQQEASDATFSARSEDELARKFTAARERMDSLEKNARGAAGARGVEAYRAGVVDTAGTNLTPSKPQPRQGGK